MWTLKHARDFYPLVILDFEISRLSWAGRICQVMEAEAINCKSIVQSLRVKGLSALELRV